MATKQSITSDFKNNFKNFLQTNGLLPDQVRTSLKQPLSQNQQQFGDSINQLTQAISNIPLAGEFSISPLQTGSQSARLFLQAGKQLNSNDSLTVPVIGAKIPPQALAAAKMVIGASNLTPSSQGATVIGNTFRKELNRVPGVKDTQIPEIAGTVAEFATPGLSGFKAQSAEDFLKIVPKMKQAKNWDIEDVKQVEQLSEKIFNKSNKNISIEEYKILRDDMFYLMGKYLKRSEINQLVKKYYTDPQKLFEESALKLSDKVPQSLLDEVLIQTNKISDPLDNNLLRR